MTILTFSAHVRHRRPKNKQEREIISDRIHHVSHPLFCVSQDFGSERPWDQHFSSWRTETRRAPANTDYTHRALLSVTPARVRCLNELIDRYDGLLVSVRQHDYSLQTTGMCDSSG